MMSIVGMNLHGERICMRNEAGGDKLLKNNTMSNLRMMSIVGMNVHEE